MQAYFDKIVKGLAKKKIITFPDYVIMIQLWKIVFYGYKEIYTPQIEWYNDGFFVSYYCPECPQSANAGYAFVPESDLSSKFKSERREDGFYIYYELKSK